MTKEMALALFRQMLALASLFGYLSPRIKSAIAIAMAIADQWEEVWALIQGTASRVRVTAHAPDNGMGADPMELMAQACEQHTAAESADKAAD